MTREVAHVHMLRSSAQQSPAGRLPAPESAGGQSAKAPCSASTSGNVREAWDTGGKMGEHQVAYQDHAMCALHSPTQRKWQEEGARL
jgi:hypothetical protein